MNDVLLPIAGHNSFLNEFRRIIYLANRGPRTWGKSQVSDYAKMSLKRVTSSLTQADTISENRPRDHHNIHQLRSMAADFNG